MAVLKGMIKASKGLNNYQQSKILKVVDDITDRGGLGLDCYPIGCDLYDDSLLLIFATNDMSLEPRTISLIKKNDARITQELTNVGAEFSFAGFAPVGEVEKLDSLDKLKKEYKGIYDLNLVENPDDYKAFVLLCIF